MTWRDDTSGMRRYSVRPRDLCANGDLFTIFQRTHFIYYSPRINVI